MKKLLLSIAALTILLIPSFSHATSPLLPGVITAGMAYASVDDPLLVAFTGYAGHSYTLLLSGHSGVRCIVFNYFSNGTSVIIGTTYESVNLHVANTGTIILLVMPRWGADDVLVVVEQ